ncbi:MAG: class 1 fructose-bisphosphatase [Candidatus Rokubacteria bacterium]|nr:class 1 fructose-bisphosphatase [Candidatus Rokubacteria bacterium]
MTPAPITLVEHVKKSGRPDADDLAVLLTQIAVAGKIIARELARAALVGQLGTTGETNVQGETVKKLDVWANAVVVRAMEETGLVTTVVSEEMDAPLRLTKTGARGRYVVCFDPVDGSSNLDVNGIVGTIFSIRHGSDAEQPGTAQVAAGYIMYGPSTLMVLTTGDGVDGFTLGPTIGEFVRSHHRIRIPARGRIYSVNEGNFSKWEPGVQRYVEYLRGMDRATGRPYTARYVGSLVADLHRTLLEGGIYLYPADAGKSDGKLRLQYEAAPMGFIAEQAGGSASTGRERIMTIEPATPHQRVPLVIGSSEDVALAEDFIAGRRR